MANQYRENFEYTYTPLPIERYAEFVKTQQEAYDADRLLMEVPIAYKGGLMSNVPGKDGITPAQAKSKYYDDKKREIASSFEKHKNSILLAKDMANLTREQLADKELEFILADEKLTPAAIATYGTGTGYAAHKKYDEAGNEIGTLSMAEAMAQGKTPEEIYVNQVGAPNFGELIDYWGKMSEQQKETATGLKYDSSLGMYVERKSGKVYKSFDEAFNSGNEYIDNALMNYIGSAYDKRSFKDTEYFAGRFGDVVGKKEWATRALDVLRPLQYKKETVDNKYVSPGDSGPDGGGTTDKAVNPNYSVQKQTVGFDPTNSKSNYGYDAIGAYGDLLTKIERATDPAEVDRLYQEANKLKPFVDMVQQVHNEFYEMPEVQQARTEARDKVLSDLGFSQESFGNAENADMWEKAGTDWASIEAQVRQDNMAMGPGAGDRIISMTRNAFVEFANSKNKDAGFEFINADNWAKLSQALLEIPKNMQKNLEEVDNKLKKKYLDPRMAELPDSTDINVYKFDTTEAGIEAAQRNATEGRNAIAQGHVKADGMTVSINAGDGAKKLDVVKTEEFVANLRDNWEILPNKQVYFEGIGDQAYMVVEYSALANDSSDLYATKDGKLKEEGTTTVKLPISNESIAQMGSLLRGPGQYGLNLPIDRNSGIFAMVNNYETLHNTSAAAGGIGGNKDWISNAVDFSEHFVEQYGMDTNKGRKINVLDDVKNNPYMPTIKGYKLNQSLVKDPFLSMESVVLPGIEGGQYEAGRVIYTGSDKDNNKPISLNNILDQGLLTNPANVDSNDTDLDLSIGSGQYQTTFINSARKAVKAKDRENLTTELAHAFDSNNTAQVKQVLKKFGISDSAFVFSSKPMADNYLWSGDPVKK